MSTKPAPKADFATEQNVQDWLEKLIDNQLLVATISGAADVREALQKSTTSDYWPQFPIDYLSRLANLRAAKAVLGSLHSLELVSKNNKNLSAAKGERLFTDLLYCAKETSTFVVIEVKNQNGSVREAITEILAYEHEILNHVPFSGSNDIKMVVVSREFSTLLDHAITGLNTWTRRQILCLRFDDSPEEPSLIVHVPKAWSAIGQVVLPADGIVTAALSFRPSAKLSEEQVYAVCNTAAALMVREAERAGGSGFAIVAHNHFYPGMADGPYLILAGVVNPFSFVQQAVEYGFLEETSSPLAKYLLDGSDLGDLSTSWDWIGCDDGAATDYLSAFGTPTWESFSNWKTIRDIRRCSSIEMDRHITPIWIDFWGVLGDYARDAVRRVERMRKFKLGLAKPGLDWRNPTLGVLLLDEIAIKPVIDAGQWTFSSLFSAGLRLGRLASFASQYADADEKIQRLLGASLFWAEVDAFAVLQELALRYVSTADITEPPPVVKIGNYESGDALMASVTALARWVHDCFIGRDQLPLMHDAFAKGLALYPVFDPQFGSHFDNAHIASLRVTALQTARDWLKWSADFAMDEMRDADAARAAISKTFGVRIPLKNKTESRAAIDALSDDDLIAVLVDEIPRIVDSWHPQLAHTLGALSTAGADWDWLEEQIRQARIRGEKNPCILIGAGGQFGIGVLPSTAIAPTVKDPDEEVLLVVNETSVEMFIVVKWVDLRSGNVPGIQ